jgi:hypothetical protein
MKEWLITLEDPPFFTFKYCKCDDGSYIGEKISTSRCYLEERFTFASNSELVADVCYQVRGYYRVKEMPSKYGQFWRERFALIGISNWADTTPHWQDPN